MAGTARQTTQRRRHPVRRHPRPAGRLLILAFTLLAAGCSTRNDPHYNRYAPNDLEPTLVERAESLVNAADEMLDNLDERLDNALD